jgi:hypothetical protein
MICIQTFIVGCCVRDSLAGARVMVAEMAARSERSWTPAEVIDLGADALSACSTHYHMWSNCERQAAGG